MRDGTVYVGSAKKAVHAFDAATGEERWTYETETNFHSRAVAVHDWTLIVGTAGTMPKVVSGDTDASKAGIALGLDAGTGELWWAYTGPTDRFTGPAVGGGRVYLGNHDGTVVALDPANGDELWTWNAAATTRACSPRRPTLPGRYCGIHGAGHLVALDAGTGERRWAKDLKAPNVKSSPAVDDDRVYVGAAGSEATDYDGPDEPTATPTPTPSPTPKCTAENEHLAAMPTVETSGSVFALSRDDGRIEWRYETDHNFRSSPAVAGGRAYIGSADGHLYCIGE